nr:membrane-spanning 4-domains subfamily A member 3-like [Camelus dromedarius]
MNIASTTIALVGLVFLSVNLAVNNPSLKNCQSFQPPDLCIYKEASSNGLVSIMLILTLLELCTASSISVKWCKANCSPLRKVNCELDEGWDHGVYLCTLADEQCQTLNIPFG